MRMGNMIAKPRVQEHAKASNGPVMAAQGSILALLPRDALGLRRILRRVDVEERIDRRVGPVGDGDAMAGGPDLDLVQVLLDQGLAQVVPQGDRP